MGDPQEPARFADAYTEHAAAVLAHIRRLVPTADAEQIVQDVFLQYWLEPARHDPSRGALRTYLKMIARFRALDFLRSSKASTQREVRWHDGEPTVHEDRRDHDADEVRSRVAALPMPLREPIVIAFYTGLSYAEVATRLGLPEGTVKWRIRTALQHLRTEIVDLRDPPASSLAGASEPTGS